MQELYSDFLARLADSYNRQPYFSNVFPWSAPGYLRAAAHLYGLDTPPVANARILELGCAAGGNCIPVASLYPQAEVVGVDISPAQIAMGRRVIDALGLTNIRLLDQCFSTLPADLGRFDYIIAHGVWSWVPEFAQEALLAVCRRHLKVDGAVYLSYNTYPGWKLQEVFREGMLFHGQQFSDVDEIARAREMLPFFLHGLAEDNPMRSVLAAQAKSIPEGAENDYYIAHEYLELHNQPIYLQDFIRRLTPYGLRHLGDVEVRNEFPQRYGKAFAQHFGLFVQGQQGQVRQQYLDFAVGRQFRKSLLVRDEFGAQAGEPDLRRLRDLLFAGWFECVSEAKNVDDQAVVRFYRSLQQEELRIAHPVHMSWMDYVHECWPRPVSGRDLIRLAVAQYPELNKEQALAELQDWYLTVPLMVSRSYEDLPPCLQDLYEGLIPGIGPLLAVRSEQSIGISDFNAWFQSSTAPFSTIEHQIVQGLAARQSLDDIARSLVAAGQMADDAQAHQKVDALVANLRKYAMYV